MSGSDRYPYFFTPFQAHPNRPLFVFLPGMDETGKDLTTLQMARLEAGFDVRCFVIPENALDDWDSLAAAAIALTQAELKANPRPAYLCGESFGGCVALEMLTKAPNLFNYTILINPASSFYRVPWLTLGSFLLPWTPHFFYKFCSNLALPFLAKLSRLSPTAFRVLAKAAHTAPKHTAEQRLQLLRQFRSDSQALQKVTQPILLIGSHHDRLLPSVAEVHRLANVFPHAQVVTLPDSGHACLIESDFDLVKLLEDSQFISFLPMKVAL